jgi:hypothetical protein
MKIHDLSIVMSVQIQFVLPYLIRIEFSSLYAFSGSKIVSVMS